MTRETFVTECEKRLIWWQIALENEKVREALAARDDKAVLKALDKEF